MVFGMELPGERSFGVVYHAISDNLQQVAAWQINQAL